jgi:hypothetical protein
VNKGGCVSNNVTEPGDDYRVWALADEIHSTAYSSDIVSLELQRFKLLGKDLDAGDGLEWAKCGEHRDRASSGCDQDVAERNHTVDEVRKAGGEDVDVKDCQALYLGGSSGIE